MRGYEIYKCLKGGYFTWIDNALDRTEALEKLNHLNQNRADDATYVAAPRATPSLLVICPAEFQDYQPPALSAYAKPALAESA